MKTKCCLISAFFISVSVWATPLNISNIRSLLDNAPMVVGGYVSNIRSTTNTPALYGYPSGSNIKLLVATIDIGVVYKGELNATPIDIYFMQAHDDGKAFPRIDNGLAYIATINATDNGMILSDPQNGIIPVDNNAFDKSLRDSKKIEDVFKYSLSSTNEDIIVSSLLALAYLNATDCDSLIEAKYSSQSIEIRLAAATASVMLGKWEKCTDIIAIWEARSIGENGFTGFHNHNLSTASWAAIKGITNKDAFPVISKMLQASYNTHIIRALIQTLAQSNDDHYIKSVMPYIEHQDKQVSYDAYVTIMRLLNRPIVTPEKYNMGKRAIINDIKSSIAN